MYACVFASMTEQKPTAVSATKAPHWKFHKLTDCLAAVKYIICFGSFVRSLAVGDICQMGRLDYAVCLNGMMGLEL